MSNLSSNQKSSYFIRNTEKTTPNSTSPESKQPKSTTTTLNIPGTRTSLQNNQLLTPIGIPSIDSFIGGGLPVGSVCLIGQDKFNTYTDIITRCFLAEGVTHRHQIYVADLSEDIGTLKERIPNVNRMESDLPVSKGNDSEELRIAWRYGQTTQNVNEDVSKAAKAFQANYFVINKFMAEREVQASGFKGFERGELVESTINGLNPLYVKLACDITRHIDEINMNINRTKKYTNICRIVINSIGGLLWNDKSTFDDDQSVSLCRFLHYLRTLLRHSLAVVLITVPNEILQNTSLMGRLTHLSDFAFSMDDSVNTISRLTKTEYNGLFRLIKIPHLNSLSAFQPETLDLAFFLKRKRLVIEQLHLPPDLGEGDDTQKGRTGTSATSMSCGSSDSNSGSKLLDF